MTTPFLPPVDRWSLLLEIDRQQARDRGTAPAPVAPVIPEGISLPQTIHFTAGTQLLGTNFDYGDELTIEESMVPAVSDKNGRIAIFELLSDPEAQRRRWGSWRVRPGPWPDGISKIQPGSMRWEIARSDHYRWARGLRFESQRDEALADARKRFGPNEFGTCSSRILSQAYGFEEAPQ